MVTNQANRWAVAAATFALWALAAASAVYWGLKLGSDRSAVPVAPSVRPAVMADPQAVARVLGSAPMASAAPVASIASRFSLVGVVANAANGGAALIAVDGKPPRPFRVGTSIDEGLVLQSVDARHAMLGPSAGPATITLELPLRK